MSDTGGRPALDRFQANLRALRDVDEVQADRIAAATMPDTASLTQGRDGSPTYAWIEDGKQHWLGATTMPEVRAAALTNAFDAALANVLLFGFGGGREVALLLDRIAPHQAVFTLDTSVAQVALAMHLTDFSARIRSGRLVLSVGESPWEDLERFLTSNDGYLIPERVLAWPWFGSSDIGEITSNLHAIGARVAGKRAERDRIEAVPIEGGPTGGIAIVSAPLDPAARALADRIAHAACSIAVPCHRFTYQEPALVRTETVQRRLDAARPELVITIATTTLSLPIHLPDAPLAVICGEDFRVTAEWAARLPTAALLCLSDDRQRRQAIEQGVDPGRLLASPPAAAIDQPPASIAPASNRLLVLANLPDASERAAGLKLESHQSLWKAAGEVLARRCDGYVDDDAAAILSKAARRIEIRIESETVRDGLTDRIRALMGPAVVCRSYVEALLDAGWQVSIYGYGWSHLDRFRPHHRGLWPKPSGVAGAIEGHAAAIAIDTGGRLRGPLMDALAAGLPGFWRTHPADSSADGVSAVLDPDTHLSRFRSPDELVAQCERLRRKPESVLERADRAARHVRAHHTWNHRLRSISERAGVTWTTAAR